MSSHTVRRALALSSVFLFTLLHVAGAQARRSQRAALEDSLARAEIDALAARVTEDSRRTLESTRGTLLFQSEADSIDWVRARRTAAASSGFRVIVSLFDRHLWAVMGNDTLLSAPIAVASGLTLEYGSRSWTFRTPRGRHTVIRKQTDPVWLPPDWHYVETAVPRGLKVERLTTGEFRVISDGRKIVVRDSVVGLLMPNGDFAELPTDEHIVFDDILFIPPIATKNRRIEGELGMYALDLGDGYMLHGTPDTESIGDAVTHGCI
jgi:hypothetical protein